VIEEVECPREAEVLEAVFAGQALPAHALQCRPCSDLALVAGALRRDAELAAREANVPPSGAVWWRMQRRITRESARRAARVVTLVYAATLGATAACVLGVLGGMPGDWLATVATTAPTMQFPLLLCAATALLLAPFAVYYAWD
jgi:hypothetical protein